MIYRLLGYIDENDWIKSSIVTVIFGLIFFLARDPNFTRSLLSLPWLDVIRATTPFLAILSFIGTILLYRGQQKSNEYRTELLEQLLESQLNDFPDEPDQSDGPPEAKLSKLSKLKVNLRDLLEKEVDRVNDYIRLTPEGDIILSDQTSRLPSRWRVLLYLVGKFYAAEADLIDSPGASAKELSENLEFSHATVRRALAESRYIEKTSVNHATFFQIRPALISQILDEMEDQK